MKSLSNVSNFINLIQPFIFNISYKATDSQVTGSEGRKA